MEKQPKSITLCTLECVLMPQGEIISFGKTIGWFKDLKEFLTAKNGDDDLRAGLLEISKCILLCCDDKNSLCDECVNKLKEFIKEAGG